MNANNTLYGQRRLVPLPHLIRSIRNRNWSLTGAISELVDNSIGHGKARNIDVLILNGTGVGVFDDGVGIDNIDRVFTLGDASAAHKLDEIGQFGVGATDACIYLGDITLVRTVRNGRMHVKKVNWREVEKTDWPLPYQGGGRAAKIDATTGKIEIGTQVHITSPAQKTYQKAGSEKLATDLGAMFAPGIRKGITIRVIHQLMSGEQQRIAVKPFTPDGLTKVANIGGTIQAGRHTLKWTGRAGLSASLTETHNGVHIGFAHRVIEVTRDPFNGASAPTLYVEVTLDPSTPWKHQLSDHKDKVVHYRQALMDSIHGQLTTLLEEAAHEAKYLALTNMVCPIELSLTAALKGAGVLHYDPDEDALPGGPVCRHGEPKPEPKPEPEPDPDHEPGKSDTLRKPTEDGEEAKEFQPKPTGVLISFRTKEWLDGKLWSWDISGKNMMINLDEDEFSGLIGWPPKTRHYVIARYVALILANAIEKEWIADEKNLNRIITRKLRSQITNWAAIGTVPEIAPYVNRAILEAMV